MECKSGGLPQNEIVISGMVRKHQTADAQLRIGESRDSRFDAGIAPE